jgi:aspartate aminotransferase
MINTHVSSLHKSATLKLTALTKKLIKEGKDIVNFAAGEPDFDTPDFIKQRAKKALDEGLTKYTPSAGILSLREEIAKKLSTENNIPVGSNNIIVTVGAKYALFAGIFTLINPGDEVIIPSPYWVSYPEMVRLVGGKIKFLKATKNEGFKITPKALHQSISEKSKLLILNYPSNPTGATYTKKELLALDELIKAHNIYVLSDEIYEKLIYDGATHTSFASLKGAAEYTLTVNGFSKAYSMTGWRIGYLAGEETIINETSKIIDHTTSCATSLSQYGALEALKNHQWQETMRKEFEARRDLLWKGLKEYPELDPVKPQGTFYLFCDITKTGLNSFDFASQLLQRQQVSCIPADPFGAEGFIRISFATNSAQIEKGIKRIGQFLSES